MNVNPTRLHFTVEDFDGLTSELRDLFVKRGNNYNQQSVVFDYFPYKPESFNTMLWIKLLRELNKQDQFEFDSIKDLIVYALFKWGYYKKMSDQIKEND